MTYAQKDVTPLIAGLRHIDALHVTCEVMSRAADQKTALTDKGIPKGQLDNCTCCLIL